MTLSSQKVLKILVSAIVGFIAGGTLGLALGAALGAILSLFISELSEPTTVKIVGLILGASTGGVIGAMVVSLGSKALSHEDKPIFGALIGMLLGAWAGLTNWDMSELPFTTMLFIGSIGLSTGALTGLVSAIFIAVRSPESKTVDSAADKQKDDEFASFMKQRLKK